jgi:hypothetical protein
MNLAVPRPINKHEIGAMELRLFVQNQEVKAQLGSVINSVTANAR